MPAMVTRPHSSPPARSTSIIATIATTDYRRHNTASTRTASVGTRRLLLHLSCRRYHWSTSSSCCRWWCGGSGWMRFARAQYGDARRRCCRWVSSDYPRIATHAWWTIARGDAIIRAYLLLLGWLRGRRMRRGSGCWCGTRLIRMAARAMKVQRPRLELGSVHCKQDRRHIGYLAWPFRYFAFVRLVFCLLVVSSQSDLVSSIETVGPKCRGLMSVAMLVKTGTSVRRVKYKTNLQL